MVNLRPGREECGFAQELAWTSALITLDILGFARRRIGGGSDCWDGRREFQSNDVVGSTRSLLQREPLRQSV